MIINTPLDTTAAPHTQYSTQRRWLMLAVLFLVATCSYLDRHIVAVLLEPIKKEFGASDTQLGLLTGFAFAAFYATLGIPVARWADRGNRRLVVTLSLVVWSGFTALCGITASFWQLALARVGVGAGEAGAIPPSQSLIVDYFPPERRGLALAIFMSSGTTGYLIAFIGGAALAASHGWRVALLVVGLPGLALALLTHFALDEPRQRVAAPASATVPAGLLRTLGELRAKRSYLWLLAGAALYGVVAYGSVIFLPSFMVRSLGVALTDIGLVFGLTSAAGALAGTLAGGWTADRLARRDVRWYAWLPALACLASLPFQTAALLSQSFTSFLPLSWIGGIFLGLGAPSMFAALHAVCGSSRRSLAVAVFTFTMSLIGSGFGPLITGAVSDALAPRLGVESLRYAMLFCTLFLVPTAWVLYRCGRAMPRDIEA
ncbi:MAG: spinster family MFS transporter [Luteimonas sp.]